MEELIVEQAKDIAEILRKDFDVLIKKNKDGTIKIQYYRPKLLKKREELTE